MMYYNGILIILPVIISFLIYVSELSSFAISNSFMIKYSPLYLIYIIVFIGVVFKPW